MQQNNKKQNFAEWVISYRVVREYLGDESLGYAYDTYTKTHTP